MDSLLQPLGHDYQAVVTAPTHDKMGYHLYLRREGCGHNYERLHRRPGPHLTPRPSPRKQPAQKKGVMTFTCDCGKRYTQPIPRRSIRMIPSSRSLTAPTWAIPPTPAPSAAAAIRTPFVDATGHDCEATVVEPTCTGYGYTEHACKHCDYHYTSDIRQPLGHQGELQLVKEASCTEDGYTGDTVCTVCDEVIQTGKLIPATGHSFGEWAVTQEADCFHDGLQVRACTVCGQRRQRLWRRIPNAVPPKPSPIWTAADGTTRALTLPLAKGFMNGMDTGIFSPDTNITRGQLVTVLYRLADEPQVQTNAPLHRRKRRLLLRQGGRLGLWRGIAEGVTKERFAPMRLQPESRWWSFRSLCPPEWQDRRGNRRSA